MDIQRLVIADPSGNITAIVFDPIPLDCTHDMRNYMREVGAKIQSTYPAVEQVVFVQQTNGKVHAEMAGGEFCGNAARAIGYMLASGKDGQQTFTMSGTSAPVTTDITQGFATLSARMPLLKDQIIFENASVSIVHLEGISHAIMTPEHPLFGFLKRTAERPDRWRTVTDVLEDLGIKNKPASGLILSEKTDSGISITPYVYVREVHTLYPEKACASGSIAAAMILGNNQLLGSTGLFIQQPSAECLAVKIKPARGESLITVAGSMRVLWDGPAAHIEYSAATLLGRHGPTDERQRLQSRSTLIA